MSEMVKVALQDLDIEKICLLTNNPSKVSDISSLGIFIKDVIKLAVKPCKYNRKYLNTKRQKFSHFSIGKHAQYQYQFYASNPECIHEIGQFLKDKPLDPLLRICAAIYLDHDGLSNQSKTEKITEACQAYPIIRPVLHFSFAKSKDWVSDLKEIEKIQGISKIQINDFNLQHLPKLEWFVSSKEIDIPLSSENFELIRNKKIRKFIKTHHCLIVLDDSKGTGKPQKQSILKDQIDTLLKYGINRIGLAGGFGPDSLETYFRLKRFYRINTIRKK